MAKRDRSSCKWCSRKGIAFIIFLMMGLLAACEGNSHIQLHIHNHKESYLQYYTEADIQQFESTIAGRQKQHSAQISLLHNQANDLLKRFQQEVNHWGNTHLYHDPYNGFSYKTDYEYNQAQGFGSNADEAVNNAHTAGDYRAAIALITTDLAHLQAMESDEADKTPWNRPHASDLKLIHYHHLSGQIIIVSFIEQACRIYQNGKLIKSFQVTTGHFGDPSPPGLWHIFRRRAPAIFRSYAPVGSPSWYPPTPISYAMEYHEGGYYLHDSWWRVYYGPGTNFPHYDPGGERFAGNGSHGCINLPLRAAAWLYANTGYGTAVITY